jgi:hypothetical protein
MGIDINNTRIINIYHHRDQWLHSRTIREELERGGNRNGFALATSTVTIASGMVMGASHMGVCVRSKKSSMVGD